MLTHMHEQGGLMLCLLASVHTAAFWCLSWTYDRTNNFFPRIPVTKSITPPSLLSCLPFLMFKDFGVLHGLPVTWQVPKKVGVWLSQCQNGACGCPGPVPFSATAVMGPCLCHHMEVARQRPLRESPQRHCLSRLDSSVNHLDSSAFQHRTEIKDLGW